MTRSRKKRTEAAPALPCLHEGCNYSTTRWVELARHVRLLHQHVWECTPGEPLQHCTCGQLFHTGRSLRGHIGRCTAAAEGRRRVPASPGCTCRGCIPPRPPTPPPPLVPLPATEPVSSPAPLTAAPPAATTVHTPWWDTFISPETLASLQPGELLGATALDSFIELCRRRDMPTADVAIMHASWLYRRPDRRTANPENPATQRLHAQKLWIVPVNLNASHFALYLADLRGSPSPVTLYVIDSVRGPTSAPLSTSAHAPYVTELLARLRHRIPDTVPIHLREIFVPHQGNSIDCGVFVARHASQVLARGSLQGIEKWSQAVTRADTPNFRRHMLQGLRLLCAKDPAPNPPRAHTVARPPAAGVVQPTHEQSPAVSTTPTPLPPVVSPVGRAAQATPSRPANTAEPPPQRRATAPSQTPAPQRHESRRPPALTVIPELVLDKLLDLRIDPEDL